MARQQQTLKAAPKPTPKAAMKPRAARPQADTAAATIATLRAELDAERRLRRAAENRQAEVEDRADEWLQKTSKDRLELNNLRQRDESQEKQLSEERRKADNLNRLVESVRSELIQARTDLSDAVLQWQAAEKERDALREQVKRYEGGRNGCPAEGQVLATPEPLRSAPAALDEFLRAVPAGVVVTVARVSDCVRRSTTFAAD